mmetsp:Transcript_9259/g.20594  ORF Transcript_9259/g.20594 Transcript_9259/m.20594 type:complete len:99 (+) Transcript_9259:401-697(+)
MAFLASMMERHPPTDVRSCKVSPALDQSRCGLRVTCSRRSVKRSFAVLIGTVNVGLRLEKKSHCVGKLRRTTLGVPLHLSSMGSKVESGPASMIAGSE